MCCVYVCRYIAHLALPDYNPDQDGQYYDRDQYENALLFAQLGLIHARLPHLRSAFVHGYLGSLDRRFYGIYHLPLIVYQGPEIFKYLIDVANVTL